MVAAPFESRELAISTLAVLAKGETVATCLATQSTVEH